MPRSQALDHATLEAAARWYVDLRGEVPDEATREAHRRWLECDPRHVQAWERLARLQDKLGQVAPGIAAPERGGKPFEPTKGEQYEVGVKYQPFEKTLITASVYQVKRSVATTGRNGWLR